MSGQKRKDVDPELSDDLGPELEFRGDQLIADLEDARNEAAVNLETARRVQAEFENYRKRVSREQEAVVKRACERVVVNLLPVIDSLERAIDHVASSGAPESLEGMKMVLSQLLDVVAKEGVTQIDPDGQPFDPLSHQAVGQREDLAVPDGTVVEVYQCGYTMHGRVIRPASVVVSTGGPARDEE